MISPTDDPKVTPDHPPVPQREAVQRWRLTLARDALDDAAQREQQAAWEAAIGASGLPAAGLDLPRPRPRFALGSPLAAGIPGEQELLDLFLVDRLPAWRVREAISGSVPAGYRLVDAYDVWLGEPPLPGRVAASVYRATFAAEAVGPAALRAAAGRLLDAPALPRERRKGEARVTYDLRPFLDGLQVGSGGVGAASTVLWMTLRHDPERGVGRPDEVLAALGDELGGPITPVELVRECLQLGNPAAARAKGRQGQGPASRRRT